ncbi:MAG: acyltransferase [Candidatus Thorarchaeota archaeon]|nr:acyltransferase [Candidatus Thorarchaeota archaeon]
MSDAGGAARRSQWIDASKGIGLLCVITVHSMIPDINPVTIHLSSFTIPLFFILAGLTYNSDAHRYDLRHFVMSRGRQYLIPYFMLYLLTLVLFSLLQPYVATYLTPDQLLFWFFYGSGPPDAATHLWFLPVMYFGLVLFALIDRLTAHLPTASRIPFLFLLPFLASVVEATLSLQGSLVPWHLNAVLISTTFSLIGNQLRRLNGLNEWSIGSAARDLALASAGTMVLLLLSSVNGFTDIAVDNTGASVWLYMVNGTMGSAIVFTVAGHVARSGGRVRGSLVSLGNYSQEVYEIHPIMFYLVPVSLVLLGWTSTQIAACHSIFWPLRLVIGTGVSFLAAKKVISRHRITRLMFRGSTAERKPPLPSTRPTGSQS